jgi:hypothetical protein
MLFVDVSPNFQNTEEFLHFLEGSLYTRISVWDILLLCKCYSLLMNCGDRTPVCSLGKFISSSASPCPWGAFRYEIKIIIIIMRVSGQNVILQSLATISGIRYLSRAIYELDSVQNGANIAPGSRICKEPGSFHQNLFQN